MLRKKVVEQKRQHEEKMIETVKESSMKERRMLSHQDETETIRLTNITNGRTKHCPAQTKSKNNEEMTPEGKRDRMMRRRSEQRKKAWTRISYNSSLIREGNNGHFLLWPEDQSINLSPSH